ncbi:uncharacterized protein TNCV_1445691 [Trichonephila clavipes]|nr:uncharacterized protein TNCV_1445691 [Trichonephila clavipes]
MAGARVEAFLTQCPPNEVVWKFGVGVLAQVSSSLDRGSTFQELPVHVNKQAGLPAYLKQLALERIDDIPIVAVQVYMDGNRDDYYRSGRGIYIKSQDHILRIQRRDPDGCSVFRNLEGNEIADTLAKAGACEVPKPSARCQSVRCNGPGLALLTNGGGQQQQTK